MTKKTAMMEMIRIMQETMANERCDMVIAKSIKAHIRLATELLQKEKDQIMDTFEEGCFFGSEVHTSEFSSKEDYYTKTFRS